MSPWDARMSPEMGGRARRWVAGPQRYAANPKEAGRVGYTYPRGEPLREAQPSIELQRTRLHEGMRHTLQVPSLCHNDAVTDHRVQIGRVIKPHGVKGEIVVDPTTDDPATRFAPGTTLTGVRRGAEQSYTIAAVRPHQGRLLVTLEEVPDRTAAETLRGLRFLADPVIDDEDDAYYDHELEGLRVLNVGPVSEQEANARAYEGAQPEPEDIGEVTGVLRGPVQRLLQVTLDDDGREVLIPFVHAIVPIVDLDNEAIVITPPEGLLDL